MPKTGTIVAPGVALEDGRGAPGAPGSPGSPGSPGTPGPPGEDGDLSYDPSGFIEGRPGASAKVLGIVAVRSFQLPDNLAGSVAHADTAATATATFTIQRNGSSIGSFSFAASATTATFTFADPVTFASGDRLTVIAPSSSDATLADIYVTLAGELVI